MNNKKDWLDRDLIVKKGYWSGRRKVSYAMISPAFVILLLLAIGPLAFMIYNAFRQWNLTIPGPSKFIGVQNFIALFKDARFWNAFSNTIILMIAGIIIQGLLGLFIAMLLKDRFKFRNVIIALLLTPILISPTVVGFNWKLLFDYQYGPINYFLSLIGIQGPIWLASTKFWAMVSILIVDTWQWTPLVALILLAGLDGIPNEIYEAANVDGANQRRVFFKLTLPLLKPMFVIIILLRIIFIFKIYDSIVILTQGGPGIFTESLSLLTYNIGIKYTNVGYAMALGILQVIFMIIVANIFLKLTQNKQKV
jgi:multiple sugar transport system permease protein